jgi:hypothetical protein
MKESEKLKLKQTQGCLGKISKACNYLSGLALIIDFVVRCTVFARKGEEQPSRPTDPFYYFLSLYLIPFAVVIFAAELEWRSIIKYVMFLKSQSGRGIFLVFVGLLIFNPKYPADIAISIYLAMAGLFNLVIAWVLPAVAHFKFLK